MITVTVGRSLADWVETAASLIEDEGWWDGQGSMPLLSDGDPRVCAVSAITRAVGTDYYLSTDIVRAVALILGFTDLAAWNDSQPDGPTVVAALRAAAENMRVSRGR